MTNTNWPVLPNHVAPICDGPYCVYCKSNVGEEHRKGCVYRQRSVIVKLEIEIIKIVPEEWEVDMINFHMDGSSSCKDNLVDDLIDLMYRQNQNGSCLCGIMKPKYVREANQEDHQKFYKDLKE